MARRQHLTEAQVAELFDPPAEQRDLVRHYTLSGADLIAIRRCRGDHNRLGHAVMLCYVRYPGRPLRSAERPPRPLLEFVADQIGVLPDSVDGYLATERNRRAHAVELRDCCVCVRLAHPLRPISRHGFCRWPSRMTGSFIWRGLSSKNADSVGSRCLTRMPLSISALRCATRRELRYERFIRRRPQTS